MNASRHNTIENHTNYPEDAIALTSSCQNFGIRYLEPRSFRETRQDVRRTPPTGAKTKESKSIISGRGGVGVVLISNPSEDSTLDSASV